MCVCLRVPLMTVALTRHHDRYPPSSDIVDRHRSYLYRHCFIITMCLTVANDTIVQELAGELAMREERKVSCFTVVADGRKTGLRCEFFSCSIAKVRVEKMQLLKMVIMAAIMLKMFLFFSFFLGRRK